MKKAIALMLCLLMAGMCLLTSCNGDSGIKSEAVSTATDSKDDSSSSEDANSSDSEWVDGVIGYLGDGKWGRKMPDFKWTDKDTFTVLVYSNEKQTTYYSEEIEPGLYTTTDDIITSAVSTRNNAIFDKYGVQIKAQLAADVYETLTQQLQAPDENNCDAAMPFLTSCATLAQNGQLYDLRDFEADGYIDLSMPWWEKNATDSFSIADKVYFSISDMSIMQKIVSTCIMFNKDLLAQKHPDLDLYDEVNNKTWTIDKMYSLAKEYTYESDNEDGLTWTDNWGISASYSDSAMMYLSSGARLITKNAEDEPSLSLGIDERSITVAQKILGLLEEKDTWAIHAQNLGTDIWVKSLQIFGENRALFRTTAFSAVKKVRAYDCNFGLIPFPLMDESQEDYYTPCSAKYAYGIVIPISCPDAEYSAFMLDVISAVSKGENASGLTRAYQEVVLKGKDLDDESGEMLDKYIFSNIVYDLGIIYNFGVDSIFTELMTTGSTEIVSKLDAAKNSIESSINTVIDTYKTRQ